VFSHKASFPALAGLAMLGAASAATTAHAADPQKFQSATGRVTYKLTSQMMNGTNTLMWTDFGKRFRQDTKATVSAQGRTMDMNTWVLSDGKNVYMHTPMQGQTATRMKVDPKQMAAGAGMNMMAAPKNLGKSLGKATIAGKECEIHDMPNGVTGKIWVWQNLPLKLEISGKNGVGMTMEATKVESPVNLSASLFQVPAGMKIQDFQMPARGAGMRGMAPKKP
jgi:hypothetical protein